MLVGDRASVAERINDHGAQRTLDVEPIGGDTIRMQRHPWRPRSRSVLDTELYRIPLLVTFVISSPVQQSS